MNALHLELIVSGCAIDFRDAQSLAMACKSSRDAFRQGPLCLVTDIERLVTHNAITRLFHMLRWCGAAVRVLRLDQQPQYLWEPELTGHERAAAWERAMCQMPYPSSVHLKFIGQHCLNLEELAIHEWPAFTGMDVHYDQLMPNYLCGMPRLRCVHLPTTTARAWPNRRMALEGLLEHCAELTQLDVAVSFPCNAVPLLTAPYATRLTQLRVHYVGPQELGLLARSCPHLRRLHLFGCDLGGLDLTSALPAELTVLTMEQCQGAIAVLPFERVHTHFNGLQMLIFGMPDMEDPILPSEGADSAGPDSAGRDWLPLLRAMSTQRSLRVLDVSNLAAVDDVLLSQLAAQCACLHTLHMPYTGVSAAGFDQVRFNPALLPRLRVITYCNDSYERDLDEFFSMAPEELEESMEDDLYDLLVEGCYKVMLDPAPVRTFYAFCALVVERGLIVPSERHGMHVLPEYANRLSRDYFCLSL